MNAVSVVDILLDAADTKFLQSIVSGSFAVKLAGVSNYWTGASCCDAILRGDGTFTLLNDYKDVVWRTRNFTVIKENPGYYGSDELGKTYSIKWLHRMYPGLVGQPIKVWITTKDPKFADRPNMDYTGVVQKR